MSHLEKKSSRYRIRGVTEPVPDSKFLKVERCPSLRVSLYSETFLYGTSWVPNAFVPFEFGKRPISIQMAYRIIFFPDLHAKCLPVSGGYQVQRSSSELFLCSTVGFNVLNWNLVIWSIPAAKSCRICFVCTFTFVDWYQNCAEDFKIWEKQILTMTTTTVETKRRPQTPYPIDVAP